MAIFKGAAVAIVTPFHEDKTVNFEKFGELIEDQIAGGTDAIVVCGTTGESSTLTHEEHLEVIKYCVEKVAGRIPVIAGTGSNCTETAIYLSAEAEKYGVDGVLLVTPYYNKATQFGLFQHFKAIADSIKVPCILYNVPSRTGCNIQPETAVRLCTEVENIVGIKEASGDISQIAKLMSDETWLNAKKAHEMGFVDGILFTEKKMPVVPKEEEPDEEEKEDTLTAMTYSKSRNLSAFLSKVSASAESVTGTPIDQLEKRLALLKY